MFNVALHGRLPLSIEHRVMKHGLPPFTAGATDSLQSAFFRVQTPVHALCLISIFAVKMMAA